MRRYILRSQIVAKGLRCNDSFPRNVTDLVQFDCYFTRSIETSDGRPLVKGDRMPIIGKVCAEASPQIGMDN